MNMDPHHAVVPNVRQEDVGHERRKEDGQNVINFQFFIMKND